MVSTNDEIVNEVASVEVQQQAASAVTTDAAGDMIKAVISDEDFEKAQKTFQLGKKNLLLNKYDESVNNIEEACKIYSAKFGELDPQCAEIYFFYGRALLELARVENTVLGNALNGVPEDSEPINDSRYGNPDEVAAEEKDEIAEKVMDALCSNEGNRSLSLCLFYSIKARVLLKLIRIYFSRRINNRAKWQRKEQRRES
jgi:hypothetical protein